jgi:hypothetical protein
LIDDFNTGSSRFCDGNITGSISSPCPIIQNSYVKMAYNVITPTASAWLPLNLGNKNLSAWDSVWIVIKGKNGGEQLYAEFKNCDSESGEAYYPKVKISDHLIGGITTDWRAAAIPFSAFVNLLSLEQRQNWSWSCIDRFSIVAHYDISSGSGEVYVDFIRLLPSTVLIDDFWDQELKNELGGESGPWCDTGVPGPCNPTGIITPTFPNGKLELSYNVISPTAGGYWTKLINTNLVSQKAYLFFEVQGAVGGEQIEAEFKDCGPSQTSHYAKIKVADYLEGGITKTEATVAIPLAAFVTLISDTDSGVNWNCIDQFSLNVDSKPQYNSGKGTVYIDNVRLVPASALPYRLPILIDRFHDCNDWNALNWKWYSQADGGGTFTAISDEISRYGNYGCGYHFTFTIQVAQNGYTWAELKGLDVTNYSYLEFYIKANLALGEQFEETHVYLGDRSNPPPPLPYIEVIRATNNWQRVLIPLSNFASHGVNLTDLGELKFAYEGGVRQGEVYVDEISFMRPWIMSPIILHVDPTKLFVRSINTGHLNIEIRDPNRGGIMLGGCSINPTIPDQTSFCANFEPVGTYKFIVSPTNCPPAEGIFHDAAPGAIVTRLVQCN